MTDYMSLLSSFSVTLLMTMDLPLLLLMANVALQLFIAFVLKRIPTLDAALRLNN
jgi:hypothetical protein